MKMKVFLILLSFLTNVSITLCAKQRDKYIEINSSESTEILENIRAVACNGDTTAYKNLMLQIPYYDFFVYSVYMASEFNYPPAYYNAYRIYDRWLNLYDTQIDTTSWKNLRFWLQWGVDAGSTACEQVLRDGMQIAELKYKTLDSLNNFVFVIPRNDYSSDSIRATLAGERRISISKEQFEKYKMQRIRSNDSVSEAILETYAYNNDYGLEKYTINNIDVFPINENFMFRIHNHLKYGDCPHITFSILWHLSNTHMLCYDFNHTFCNKLGLYLLHLGYEAGDRYSTLPLAQLYAQGYHVPRDIEYAKKILTSIMSESAANKLVQKWIREDKN